MPTISSLPPKGAVKQGATIAVLDFTETGGALSTWTLKLVKSGDKFFLFGLHSGDPSGLFKPLKKESADTWKDSELGNLKSIIRLSARPEIDYITYGVTAIPANTSLDIIYTDGAGNFSSTPYTDASTQDQIKDLLSQVTGSTDTPDTNTKKWYQKPVNWLIGGLVLAGGTGLVIYLKKKFSN